jgi:putative nucleotidyltransferase with HDIG domain
MLRTRVRVGPASGLIISVVFAALLSGLGAVDLFVPQWAPSYGQATQVVLRVPYTALTPGSFHHSRVLVPRGTVLDKANAAHRAAREYDDTRRPVRPGKLAGGFALHLFALLVLTSYMRRFGHPRLKLMRSQVGLLLLILLTVAIGKAVLLFAPVPPYWIPASAVALWAAVGFDRRTAMLVDLAVAFVTASLLRFELLVMMVFVARGLTIALLFKNRKQSRQMLLAGLLSGLVAAAALIALEVLFEGKTGLFADLSRGLGSQLLACVGGGVVAGILGVVLREPAERVMGHVSRSRLLDLTDIEAPLLRKMANEAPGSWEHSRAMANLAEAAAASVGADSLLTRVGAYYHDLGKTVQPEYFIENLGGDASPHHQLEPEVSADAIMAHVVLGTKILRDGGVPEPVVEFAYTHHGTQLVEYFWSQYQARHPADEAGDEALLTEAHFRYPGMRPMSKETAILMLVDSIEAASRTVEPPERDEFEEMIRRIVFHKIKSGQLDDSGLTLSDLRVLTERMAATLVNMSHGRIKYPWQRKKEAEARRAADKTRPAQRPQLDADKSQPFELKRVTGEGQDVRPVTRPEAAGPEDAPPDDDEPPDSDPPAITV